jgi:hypothetical protein
MIRRAIITFLTLQGGMLNAAPVDGEFFSLEVPKEWAVSGNGQSVILAHGKRLVDATPMPFLSIQSCNRTGNSKGGGSTSCREPCTKASLNFLSDSKAFVPSPVVVRDRAGQVVEYHTEAKTGQGSAQASLLCGPVGDIYISYVTDYSIEISRTEFAEIVESVKWK